MSNRLDEFGNQARLWDEEDISEIEREALELETLESPSEGPLPLDKAVEVARAATAPEITDAGASFAAPLIVLIRRTPDNYLIALGAGALAVVLSWRMPPLAWLAVVLGIMALQLTRAGDGRWMVWISIVLGGVFTIVNLTSGPAPTPSVAALPDAGSSEVIASLPPDGSLGIRFDTLAEEWNSLDQPPFITTAIKPTPEAGTLDSFLYRFDGSTVLAGAYNPSDQYIYAILMRAGLRHESISQMYVRLCYLIHQGSQDCLDRFIDENDMFGKTPLDFIGVVHDVTWSFEGNEWRLTISHDIQTIRVNDPQGPD